MQSAFATLGGGTTQISVEYRIRRPDGSTRWILERGFHVRDAAGRVVQLVGVAKDITTRKQMDQALLESQALYRSLVTQLPIGIFEKDLAGRYVLVNPAFCKFKGLPAERFLGKTPQEVGASAEAKNDTTDRATKYAAAGEDHHQQILRTGKPIEVEEEYVLPDG